jgi:maleate cis-trans isomerase
MFLTGETYGWRAKIGFICPGGDWCGCLEYYPLLPEGVSFSVTTLGVERMAPDVFESIFSMYYPAAKKLEAAECDVIVAGGAAPFNYLGYTRVQEELMNKLREDIKVPVTMSLDAHFDALRALSAKKIVIVTPDEDARNEERKTLCESVGFEVLNIKGLGISRKLEIGKLPHYASYRLAMQAIREAPEADAIYISCPLWPTVRHIEQLEEDSGKPVVADVAAIIWASLKAIGLKTSVPGFGTLLRDLL